MLENVRSQEPTFEFLKFCAKTQWLGIYLVLTFYDTTDATSLLLQMI